MANSELGLATGSFQAELKRLTDSSMIHILAAAEADIAAQRTDPRHLQELEQRETDIDQRERAILRKEAAVADREVAVARREKEIAQREGGLAAYMAPASTDSTAESELLEPVTELRLPDRFQKMEPSRSKSPLTITPSSPSVAKVCEKFGKVKAKANQSPSSCLDSVPSPCKSRGLSYTREPTAPCMPTPPCNEPYSKAPVPCHSTTVLQSSLSAAQLRPTPPPVTPGADASSQAQDEESDQPAPGGASKLKQLFEQKARANSASCNRVPPRAARISAPAGRIALIPTSPPCGELSRAPREQRSSVPMIPRAPSSIHSGAPDAITQREQRNSVPAQCTATALFPRSTTTLEKLLMADEARSTEHGACR